MKSLALILISGSVAILPCPAQAGLVLYSTGVSTSGSGSALFSIDLNTGLATQVGPTGIGYFLNNGGIAYDSRNGVLYGEGDNTRDPSGQTTSELFRIDQLTGAATPIGWNGPMGLLSGGGLAYDPVHDKLFATGQDNSSGNYAISTLYSVDPISGAAAVIGPNGPDTNLGDGGLAFDVSGGNLIATGNRFPLGGGSFLFDVDPASGAAMTIGATLAGYYLDSGGLASDPITGNLYATGVAFNSAGSFDSFLFKVDRLTGAAAVVGPTDAFVGLGGLAFVDDGSSLNPVPEPGSLQLALSSVITACVVCFFVERCPARRRRRCPRASLTRKTDAPEPVPFIRPATFATAGQ